MKFHRVLLFTTLQMDVTPVGEDLHVLLTSDNIPYIGCTALSTPIAESDPPACSTQTIESCPDASGLFITYVADRLCRLTGKRVLCTGGVFVDEPDEHQTEKLYENIDDLIRDWTMFLSD